MLSSKNDSNKVEERFLARIDMLTERVDTLASTVATTASAIAKKDGEIAVLRRDLQARDEQLQALAARAQASSDPDPRELHELRKRVEVLVSERATKGGSKQLDELTAKVTLLGQRLETISSTVSTTAAGLAGRDGEIAAIRKYLETTHAALQSAPAPSPELERRVRELGADFVGAKARLDGQAAEIEAVKTRLSDPHAHADELRAMLTTLRTRVEALDGLRAGVAEEELEERLGEISSALDGLSQRLDSLAVSMESATANLGDKEHELAALHRHFTESSSRIAVIAEELVEAKGRVTEEQLAQSVAGTRGALDEVERRMDALATRVDSGMTSLDDKEQRLRALDRQAAESTSRIESLAADLRAAKVGVTEEQLDEHLAKTAAQLDSLAQRIDKLGSSVESGTASLTHNKQRLQDLDRRVTETGSRIESLTADLRDAKAGVTKEELDDRLTEMKAALSAVGERIDELAAGVKSASTSHSNEEQKLEALHRQVSQSSSRIESIADDLRETLGAFPEATPDQLGELGARIDIVEKRVATVAAEVGRAKTLWPVALRSLEARLEDVTARSHETPEAATGHSTTAADQPADEADDLLAGLRDSLQAMESVAAEMEQAPEVDPTDDANDATPTAQQAIAGGARIVPLRSSDP